MAAKSETVKVTINEDTTTFRVPLRCQRCACYRDDQDRMTLEDSLCLLVTDQGITQYHYHDGPPVLLAIFSCLCIFFVKVMEETHDKLSCVIMFILVSAGIYVIMTMALLLLTRCYGTIAIEKYSKDKDYERFAGEIIEESTPL
ncbi:hypothetical protein OTU49_005088, partial [Cherax quadricarinatus]